MTIHLVARDALGFVNVPLAVALIRRKPEHRIEHRYITLACLDKEPTASFCVQTATELSDQETIVQVGRDVQHWLSNRISQLQEMRNNLEIISDAYPNA